MVDTKPEALRATMSRRALVSIGSVVASAVIFGALPVDNSHAESPSAICGDATGDGEIKSGDGLMTLHAAVGIGECVPPRCDVNQSGSVSASDALLILESAVGQDVALTCPSPPSTTTTSSSTTTTSPSTTTTSLSPTCGNGEIEPGEDCEEGFCRGGCNLVTRLCVDLICLPDCTCPEPACGDAILDAGEGCDPPGSECVGGTCSANCECVP